MDHFCTFNIITGVEMDLLTAPSLYTTPILGSFYITKVLDINSGMECIWEFRDYLQIPPVLSLNYNLYTLTWDGGLGGIFTGMRAVSVAI